MKETFNEERLTEPSAEAFIVCPLQASFVKRKLGGVDACVDSHGVPSCSMGLSAMYFTTSRYNWLIIECHRQRCPCQINTQPQCLPYRLCTIPGEGGTYRHRK